MKLLHAVHGYPPEFQGGTERYVATIAAAQAAAGHEVAVIAGTMHAADTPTLAEEDAPPIRLFRVRGLPSRRHHWSEFADPFVDELIQQRLAASRPDLVHLHHWMRLSSRLVTIAAELGIPAVVTLHDTGAVCPRIFRLKGDLAYCDEPYEPTLCQTCAPRHPWQGDDETAELLAVRYRHLMHELTTARRLIVPSRAHAGFLARVTGLPVERFALLPHPSLFHPAPPDAAGAVEPPAGARPLRIGCFGSLVPHKGQDVLLQAIALLPSAPPWEVHIFGSPENADFAASLEDLAEGLPVHFHGSYHPAQLAAAGLDLAVFPSLAPESFSFTLDEALTLGLPVVVSSRGALPERAGEAGLAVPAGDPGALAGGLRRLLEEADLRARLAAGARARPPRALESHLAGLDALYGEARANPPGTAPAAGDLGTEIRLRHRQVLDREARIQELESAAHRLEVVTHVLETVTQSRGWKFVSFLREAARVHRPTPEQLRGLWRLFRKALVPPRPLELQYQAWLATHVPSAGALARRAEAAARLPYRPLVSVITPVCDVNERWLVKAIESVQAQAYDHWELCLVDDASSAPHVRPVLEEYARTDGRIRVLHLPARQGIVGASNAGLGMATGEYLAFLDHDDELAPHALSAVVTHLNRHRDTDLIYTDEDKVDERGHRFEPAFKPDWAPDLFRSFNYLGHLCVVRAELVAKLGGFRPGFDGSQDYDLLLRLTETTDRIAHIPDVLYSWRTLPGSTAGSVAAKTYAYDAAVRALRDSFDRRGVAATVTQPAPGRYTVRYPLRDRPLVSVVIPMRDRARLTRACLRSIERKTTYPAYEVLIVDNGSVERETADLLEDVRRRHRVLRYDAPFNFSAIVNVGARHAQGTVLLFLNNDTTVISPDWIEALLEHAQRPEVGAVGGLLLYPNRRIQHAGVFLMGTPLAVAGHRFKLVPARHPGYLGIPQMIGNVSAVTAACMMVRREVFEAVGGFAEAFRVALGDVDFCLRLRDRGFLVVYTPLARLYHHESASRGALHPRRDDRLFRDRWRRFFEGERDPYWNPNLAADSEIFGLAVRRLPGAVTDARR